MTQHLSDKTAADAIAHEPFADGSRSSYDTSSYVLVVDDDSAVRDFFTRSLEGWGYTVKQAGSAAEALAMMVAKPAAMVLCDIKMPGQDGMWLVDRLHAHWPGTPVVMATAVDDLETVRQSRSLGAVDYITKPITPEQLLQVVRRAAPELKDELKEEERHAPEESTSPPPELRSPPGSKIDAEYTLECPVRCPACGERIVNVKAVRLVRTQVNFTSTLPRRGRVIACPFCLAVIPGELSNF